ncbi:MAG: HlyD family efflux transporter periplasmic adaptor subunit [Cyanobacteria bacterium Co-bin13]|nr:HlyD family efflux transporter periplasmic adaptor subunit [Cyanobacteria bacterium Co-bin13]
MKLRAAATAALFTLSAGCALPFSQTEETVTPVVVEASSVVALGRIEPEGEVIRLSVPNAADSRVNEIRVAEGDWVEAGQVIAVLQGAERRQAELRAAHALVEQRQAELTKTQKGSQLTSLEAQQAKIDRLEAQLLAQAEQRRAAVARSQATLQASQLEYQRYQQLAAVGAISRSELDTAQRDYDTAQADLSQRQAELNETETTLRAQLIEEQARLTELQQVRPEDIAIAQAQLQQSQTQVAQRQADLDDVLVRAPVAGQILKINTQIGEQVNTQQGIVELAQTSQMMVIAEIYETDIRKVRLGQSVTVTSEYGGINTDLKGTVDQVGLQIGTASFGESSTDPTQDVNARVVTVKIRLDPQASEQVAALTGMQVRVAIDADTQVTRARP